MPARRLVGLVAAMVCVGSASAAASSRPATLVSADESRIVFQVDASDYNLTPSRFLEGTERLEIAGFGTFSAAGEPQIPGRDFLVALPPRARFTLRYTIEQSQALGRHRLEPVSFPLVVRGDDDLVTSSEEYRLDAAIYDPVRSVAGVSLQPEGRLRHQRVLPVRVVPVTYDASTGETMLATSIRVEIDLSPSEGGGLQGDPVMGPPARETAAWERIYERVLVNPTQAKTWRVRPARRPKDIGSAPRVSQATAGPLVKLKVRESGLHRVRAASVIGEGFPAGTPTSQLHVFKRWYNDATLAGEIADIPFKVVEDGGGVSGEFDGADYVIFYGQRLREDTFQNDPVEKFADHNVYWLGVSAGQQMVQKAVAAGTVSGDTATASFPVTVYNEKDLFFMEETPDTMRPQVPRVPMREFYYYNGGFANSFSVPFTLGAVKSGGTFNVTARFLGKDIFRTDRKVRVDILNTKGTIRLPDADVPRKTVVDYASGPTSSDLLVEGVNTLRIQPPPGGRSTVEVLLDWFTVDYESPYRAVGDVIDFNTGSLVGDQNLTVTGLTRTDVMLIDVTDPLAPEECLLDGGHFAPIGAARYALSLQATITEKRRFLLTPLDKIKEIPAGDVVGDEASGLIGNPAENGVDVLVVAHRDFMGEIQRWVDYRRAQGYVVLLANVEDVFDEFSGGVDNARAVRRFARHFFENGGASYLVLVGDASEDNKRVHVESGINFVPTESFTEHVSSRDFNEDEVVTSDKWFVLLNKDIIYDIAPDPVNYLPSLIVGRLPVGNEGELRRLITKTLNYEKPVASDFWRRRMIRIADDTWAGLGTTCNVGDDFQTAEELAARITENSIPGGFDVVRFFLNDRISHPSGCVSAFSQTQLTRLEATPVLLGELSRGATLVSFQAHMNRYLICHEWLFTSSANLGTPDYLNVDNPGRPFVVFGMGCHMSDYAVHKELARTAQNGPNGDCLAELLLLLNNKGAVCTYGSTGFEYLRPNAQYTPVMTDVFFTDPPSGSTAPTGRSQARWIMGEVMTAAEILDLQKYPSGPGLGARGQVKRYHILGDPMLRIDAGPPRFEVTVDGLPIESGDLLLSSSAGDSVDIRAVISDEVAIEKLSLEIDGADATDQMTITPLRDVGLDAARQYEISFTHKILPKPYDIIIRAHQAADTSANEYHMVAEFVLKVEINVSLRINGRPVLDGDGVPAKGDYVFQLSAPVFIDPGLIRVQVDTTNVTPLDLSHPTPQDSTTWLVGFSANLSPGAHKVSMFVDNAEFLFNLFVGTQLGVRDVIAYPNPFSDETYFVYSNDIEISDGVIDIFTTSGRKVARLRIPVSARAVGQNAVRWNGKTWDGGDVANGVYLFVVSVNQDGRKTTHRGKLMRTR